MVINTLVVSKSIFQSTLIIHSFIPDVSIALPQVHYSEALPTTALIPCRS